MKEAMYPTRNQNRVPVKLWKSIILFLLFVGGAIFVLQFADELLPNDFIRYWASGRLLLRGENPYDLDQLYATQIEGGYAGEDKISLYNPPWIFPIIAPFGLLPRQDSQLLWLLLNITIVLVCTNQLWLIVYEKPKYRWLAWLIAFTFGPTFAALGYTGQITPFLFWGFTGFIVFINYPNKDWLTGWFIYLIAIKPQAPYLFFVLFIFWALHQRRYKLIVSFLISLLITTTFGMLLDREIITHFIQNLTGNTPVAWATPTIGVYLRTYFGIKGFSVQFIPPLLASIISIVYWWRKRYEWNWHTALPWILFISLITSPYTWTYDFVILIIPLLVGFSLTLRQRSWFTTALLITCYLIINFLYLWLHMRYSDFYFLWFAPALAIWYSMVQAFSKLQNIQAPSV